MKRYTILTAIMVLSIFFLKAQNDTMYIMKAGVVVGKHNVDTQVDSVIFYKPQTQAEFTCGGTLTDSRDDNTYSTIAIGTQCWLAENLNYGTYVTIATGQGGAGTQKYCYDNDTANCITYGGLYEWLEVMNGSLSCNGAGESQPACSSPVQGICPNGWHLPSHDEWTALERAVCSSGTCATDFPYNATTTGWRGTNEGQRLAGNESLWTNGTLDVSGAGTSPFGDSGFDALPGGYGYSGLFQTIASNGHWWSATEYDYPNAWYRALNPNMTSVNRYKYYKENGFSVRCIKG